jgi:glycosyltransferase involved in cell wall biosynthesis
MSSISVFVSHPGKQGNVYQRPRAAEQAGCKVTFLTGLYYFPERLPYSLVRYLRSPLREGIQKKLEKRRQVGLSPANVISLFGPYLESVLRPLGFMNEWWAIHDRLASAWLRRRNWSQVVSIVHCFQDSGLHTLQAAKSKGAVRILEVTLPPVPPQDFEEAAEKGNTVLRESHRRLADRLRRELDHTQWAVAQSAYSVRSIAALGFPTERILCVPLGVDVQLFEPAAAKNNAAPWFRALFVGAISRRKGFHHLLQAWRELDLKDAELIVVGDKRTVEARELLADCHEDVQAVGNLPFERLVEAYQSADLLIHPSLAEGGCNVVHEALACGVPCVVSANTTSAIRDGLEGYVVPVGDIEALKQRIALLSTASEMRTKMARAARQRAIKLSWECYVHRLGKIYLELGRDPSAMPSEAGVDAVFGIR